MNHLTDSQLNEYLDNVLNESSRNAVRAHVELCRDCRLRLEVLMQLDSHLARLPEVGLSRDLTSSVLARLHQPASRIGSPFFAAQLGAALGMVLFIIFKSAQFIRIPSLAELSSPLVDFPFVVSQFRFPISNLQWLVPEFQISNLVTPFSVFHFSFPIHNISTFQLSTPGVAFIAASILALGLTGNIVLLRERPEVRK